jgi:glycosyltransferase involved in cell wall biosynthesis
MDGGKYGPVLEKNGVRVHCLEMNRGKLSVKKWFRLVQIIKQEQAGCVQTWMYHSDLFGGLAAKVAGVKRIFWGIRMSSLEKGRSSNATRAIARLCATFSGFIPTGIICCAQKAKSVHAQIGYSDKKLQTIFNGYDVERLVANKAARDSTRAEFGVTESTFLLGMVGRYDPLKDHETLLGALQVAGKKLGKFQCALVGINMEESNFELMQIIEKLGLKKHVFLLGARDDIPALMNGLDLHVLSSCSEGFPNVVAEAMACETPCISTDVGDAALIIGDDSSVCSPGSPSELAQLIVSMESEWRNEPARWAARKRFSRNRIVEHFSIERMVEAYENTWFPKEQVFEVGN